MRHLRVFLAGLALLATAQSATACGYGMPSPAARLVAADCVVVGKMIAIENRTLPLRLPRIAEPVPHVVSIIRVESTLKGDDRLTHIRLATPAHHRAVPVGFEACFFLTAHAEEPVFLMSTLLFNEPIEKVGNPEFAREVEQLQKMARLLRDPEAGLTSKSDEERFLTAALLVTQFRTASRRGEAPANEQRPIDARLSRLILRALAECDWNQQVVDFRLTPWRVFGLLGATEQDGWKPQGADRVAEAKRWLRDHEQTFRIKAFVR